MAALAALCSREDEMWKTRAIGLFVIMAACFMIFVYPRPVGAKAVYAKREWGSVNFYINDSWSCEFSELLLSPVEEFWRWGTWESFSLKYTNNSKRGYNRQYPTFCYSCYHTSGNSYNCQQALCGVAGASGNEGLVELKPGASKRDACEIVFKNLDVR